MPIRPPSMQSNSHGKKRPLMAIQTKQIQQYLIQNQCWRDLALFMVGIDSLLRSVDLRHLKYDDVIDVHGNVRSFIIRRQQKNKTTVECHLSEPTRSALKKWINVSGKLSGDYLFTPLRQRKDMTHNRPITREAMGNIIKRCVTAIGLDPVRYSTKTLRCSRVRPILELAKNDYQIPRLLLGHADIRSTIHYCAVDQEQALEISKAVQFFDPVDLESPAPVNQKPHKNLTKPAKR